jgi:hypothetical protein
MGGSPDLEVPALRRHPFPHSAYCVFTLLQPQLSIGLHAPHEPHQIQAEGVPLALHADLPQPPPLKSTGWPRLHRPSARPASRDAARRFVGDGPCGSLAPGHWRRSRSTGRRAHTHCARIPARSQLKPANPNGAHWIRGSS